MFGSLRIARGRLTDRQRAAYRAHFCASCHALRRFGGGRPASLLTNYDQTVLALVLGALQPDADVEARPCTAMPLLSVGVQPLDEPCARLLAALDIAAVEAKLRDDVEDERRLRSRVGLRLLRGRASRAAETLADLGFAVSLFDQLPARQRAAERVVAPSLAALAEPSAELTGQIFAAAAVVTGRLELAGRLRGLGEALGRWVYVWDAVVDRRRDLVRGRFNAIAASFGARPFGSRVRALLLGDLDAVERALDALPLGERGAILAELVETLRDRVRASLRSDDPTPADATRTGLAAARAREAGECDACCDAGVCECCGGSGEGCCGASGGATTAGEGLCARVPCCPGGGTASVAGCEVCCLPCECWATKDRGKSGAHQARHAAEPAELQDLVGERGIARCDLDPGGRVRVGDVDHDAIATVAFIAAGDEVVVRGVEGRKLLVDPSETSARG